MVKRSLAILLTLVLGLGVVLSGCSGASKDDSQAGTDVNAQKPTETEPVYGGQLIYGMTQDLVSLDPHESTDAGTRCVVFNIYEGLVKPTAAGDLVPAVAESYDISSDAKSYTFTLRDQIRFQNGDPVTIKDIEYSIHRYAELSGESSAFSLALDQVTCPDDKTVVITLKQPDSEFLSQLTLAIIPDGSDPVQNPIGTGPFKVDTYKVGEYLDLSKNEYYWVSGAPYLDSVRFKFIADVNTAFTELQAGTIDVLNYLTTAQVDALQKSAQDQFRIVEGNMNLVHALFLNNDFEPFKDVRVRQAMCYAVDRDAINQFMFGGKSTLIGSHMIPSLQTWYEPSCADAYPHDVQKAKELLAEAGYGDGFELTITVPSQYSQHVDTAQIIADQLSEVGIKATLKQIEWSSWLTDVYKGRQYEATVIGFDGKLNPSDWLAKYGTNDSKNMTNYSNAEYDELLGKALAAVDQGEKAAYYKQMQLNLSENAASVYLEDPADFVAISSRFDGYYFYPTAAWDVSTIYMVKE
ncbi:MAG: ABC transporter substrate-binding protein [Firmicutes bacterium]|nr:ABC transporter substrate-binding protein [Bacillota bacterium]